MTRKKIPRNQKQKARPDQSPPLTVEGAASQDSPTPGADFPIVGTGSDGTLGVHTIKGEGGMVMAQKPSSSSLINEAGQLYAIATTERANGGDDK